jgi:hypothetical protein
LDNGTNTNSTLKVVTSGNPGANQAVIFGQLTNASVSGNLIDLRSGTSGSEVTKFAVTAAGKVGISTGATAPTTDIAFGSGARTIAIQNATSGAGGALTLQAGSAGSNASAAAGGDMTFSAGAGGSTIPTSTDGANGGSFTFNGGVGQAGGATFFGGAGGGFTVNGGTGGADSGASGTPGAGGQISLIGGTGGAGGSSGTQGGQVTIQAGNGGTGSSTGGVGGDVQIKAGNGAGSSVSGNIYNVGNSMIFENPSFTTVLRVLATSNQIAVGGVSVDSTAVVLTMDTSTATSDPTGINGAIYYSTGGMGGAQGASSYAGKFRCFEGNVWKNCMGIRDIVERRWGYAVVQGIGSTTFGTNGLLTSTMLGAGGAGGAAVSAQTESNYVSYSTNGTGGTKGGFGNTFSATAMETRWLPKLATRIRLDAAVTNARYWVGLASADISGQDPALASAAYANQYIGVGVSSAVNSSKFICGSGDGTNHSGTDMGVTMTASHYYDIIVDLSTSGNLVCSISDNGGAFTTITKTTNLPTTTTALGVQETITNIGVAARAIHIAYAYLEHQ